MINKYVHPFINNIEQNSSSSAIQMSDQEDQDVVQWFTDPNNSNENERTFQFVFQELLTRINDRLNHSPLHLAYSDPKLIDELSEMIDDRLHSVKIDLSHIHRPSLIHDLIIFMLHLMLEKTHQRFEVKYNQLLNETLNDLHQIERNVKDQINENETIDNHGQLFRRILGKEIIREIERINRQKLIAEIHTKLNQNFAIDPTDVTRPL